MPRKRQLIQDAFAFMGCFALAATLSSCTRPDWSAEALQSAGYTQIQTFDYPWFSCGNDDWYGTAFQAVGPNGQPAQGAVCCGLLKGCTIRLTGGR